jgi:phasin
MAETAATPKTKTKPTIVPPAAEAAPATPLFEMPKFDMPKFDMPKFDMPKFEIPKVEMPPAFREIAEKSLEQAKGNYEKLKAAAEKATDVLEETYSTASNGYSAYGLKLIETARANSNSAFDLFGELLGAKSASEVVEKSTAYLRTQYETMTAQAKDLAEHAKKVATETAEPIKESVASFSKTAA